MGIINKKDFYKTLFEDHGLYGIYRISQCLDKKISHNLDTIEYNKWGLFNIYSFELFPSYLNYNTSFKNSFILKKVEQKLGFLIDIKNHSNITDYLNNECPKQHKKNLTRSVNRLENCFNISYKTFIGSIAKDHYEFLMDALKKMIEKRFQQRDGRNKTLENWNTHFEKTINLINEKKASLFVIYDDDKPIEISINYHIDSIMYSSISSYDLDYGKFSLGNIEIYKQLEWCMLNNICIFDMGYGDFDYKRKWSNHIYTFEDHNFYHKYNALGSFYVLFKGFKYKLINYLIAKNINDKIYNLLDKFKKPKQTIDYLDYQIIPLTLLTKEADSLKPINLNDEKYHILKKPVYDYLYIIKGHIDSVSVYKITNELKSYIFKTEKEIIKIILNN